MNHTGRDFRKVGDAEQDRVPYMSVQEMALVHQAQAGYHGSYADAPAYVAPPPYADWQSSEVMSSIQVPFSDEVLSSAASTVSSGCLSGSSRGRRSRQRRKKAGDDSSSSSVPVFVPGTNRLLSNGSKNHHQGMCRPCYLNTSSVPCPAGMNCNFCHYEHDQAKLLESEAYSLRKKVERDFAAEPVTVHYSGQAMPNDSNVAGGFETPVIAGGATPSTQPGPGDWEGTRISL
eukprot:TRINITY_DN35861_c0_g1_i2.p1 TRINITY_DN35861_c0_g1~~TRINITY_DN35861_c0_g1_i2.p1  ORF type:complete len:232 (+),score=28.01 TRINITY_DN35861_c0_g1_i2:89-784(+)